jgi:AraC-like DNA-binding protein
MLRDSGLAARTISDIAFEAGFSDLSHFNRSFRRRFGESPSDVRVAAMRNEQFRLRRGGIAPEVVRSQAQIKPQPPHDGTG